MLVSIESSKTYCKVCKQQMKQIPLRKIDSLMVLEYYCPYCDESEIRYVNFEAM